MMKMSESSCLHPHGNVNLQSSLSDPESCHLMYCAKFVTISPWHCIVFEQLHYSLLELYPSIKAFV